MNINEIRWIEDHEEDELCPYPPPAPVESEAAQASPATAPTAMPTDHKRTLVDRMPTDVGMDAGGPS